jgi:hypothetical protein
MPDNRYMQWPLNPQTNSVFTSPAGNTWVFDGCGWVSTCCPPVIVCDPEISGISVIYSQKKEGDIFGYGVSYFTWNSNLNRYEGFIQEPMVIGWTGTEWRFALSSSEITVATSATSNILEAVFTGTNPDWNQEFGITQIECGLIYNQLCLETTYYGILPPGLPQFGPYTLYPTSYDSVLDIINGVQPGRYFGTDSNGYEITLTYDSVDLIWYMTEYGYYTAGWDINAAPNQNALILGSPWDSNDGQADATFTQGVCDTECYPQRDGITLMYNDGKWIPIYLTWDTVNGWYYSDNPYISALFGWNSIQVEYDSLNDLIKIVIDSSSSPQSIGGNSFNGGFSERLFNHNWSGGFDVYCGDVGCVRMCATFNGATATMVPIGYPSLESLIACSSELNFWIGWNGTDEVIRLNWSGDEYSIEIDGNANQMTGVTSYTSAALIANSPYVYNQGGISGTLTLTSGDCP